jgi:uncharacterized protein with ATP-grasp and redox domains
VRTNLECVACIVKQAVEGPKRFTDDPVILERIMKETLAAAAAFDLTRPPPELGGLMFQIIGRCIGREDPYSDEKRRFNRLAVALLPEIRKKIRAGENRFERALRFAIAGNALDFGAPGGRTDGNLEDLIGQALNAPICGGGQGAVNDLSERARGAEKILYLADNAGEIALDRLFIEEIGADRVTVAVRSGPTINDALLADAREVGLTDISTVIPSGVSLPGTRLDQCSEAFRACFREADLIISKGQGNYETLTGVSDRIFFLLIAKCHVVAGQLACQVGDFIVTEGSKGSV